MDITGIYFANNEDTQIFVNIDKNRVIAESGYGWKIQYGTIDYNNNTVYWENFGNSTIINNQGIRLEFNKTNFWIKSEIEISHVEDNIQKI